MALRDLVETNRSYRRFHEDTDVSTEVLTDCVDLARLSASGANAQPLKYFLSNDRATNATIFNHLSWAGYLEHWHGPPEGERPSAYIVILLDTNLRKDAGVDHGIAAQTIMLGATEKGLGGCIVGSIQREKLREVLKLNANYEILLVLAIGKPKEKVLIEKVTAGKDAKYWRDQDGTHHVPKRQLDDVIIEKYFG